MPKTKLDNLNKETLNITHEFYTQKGIVVGKLWGGGKGCYEARSYSAETLDELKEKLQKAFELGSLDKGMGFERLVAASVQIVDKSTITIDDKEYTHTDVSNFILGDKDLFESMIDDCEIYDDLED